MTLTQADWPYTIAIRATGNSADGRGARGAVPLHLEFETRDLSLQPDVAALVDRSAGRIG